MIRWDLYIMVSCFLASLLTLALIVISYFRCPKCKKRKELKEWGDNQLCSKCEYDKYFGF